MKVPRSLALALGLSACGGESTPPLRDASRIDAGGLDGFTSERFEAVEASVDVDAASLEDRRAVDVAMGCSDPEAPELLRALRAPRPPGVSAVAAPGLRFDELRTRLGQSPAARSLLAQARVTARRAVPTLARGDSASYQTLASLALAAAFVAWHDGDPAAARTALGALEAAAVTPEWLRGAREVPIFVGASLVDLAAAVDLLGAIMAPDEGLTRARDALGRALASVEAWLQSGGLLFMAVHNDNHGLRLGGGLAAASLVAPGDAVDDEVLGYALALIDRSVAQQTGGMQGWAEGTTYFAYGFEAAAPALLAVDRGWTGSEVRCVRCEGHRLAPCAAMPRRVRRPSGDLLLRDLLRWGASVESPAGWLVPVDDSRLMGVPSPIFEQLLGAPAFGHWSAEGPPGSTGGSVNVGPLVALALAAPRVGERMPRVDRWPAAGTGRLEDGPRTAFLNAEPMTALQGVGHERPDVLALHLLHGTTLVLSGSGYRDYDTRAPLARADAASIITVEGVLSRDTPKAQPGPPARLAAEGPLAGTWSQDGVTVTRELRAEGGAVVVRDRIAVQGGPREVGWHWHLRGALDASSWAWSVRELRCVATQTGTALETVRETAPHFDDYGRAETHPVVRQSARVGTEGASVETRIVCGPANGG